MTKFYKLAIMATVFSMNASMAAPCSHIKGVISLSDGNRVGVSAAKLTDSDGTEYVLEDSSFPDLTQSMAAANNKMISIEGYSSGRTVTVDATLENGKINYGDKVLNINCE